MMKYRADIDGLRAIAIVAIVFFHTDATALPGGFVLDTGYIGYHGYHQFTRWYINGCALDSNPCVRALPAFGPIDIKQTDSNNHFNGWQTSLHRQFRAGHKRCQAVRPWKLFCRRQQHRSQQGRFRRQQ